MSYLYNSMMYRFNRKRIHSILCGVYRVQSISAIVMGSIMQIPAVKLPIGVRTILRRAAIIASAILTNFRLKSDFGEGRVDVVR
jgi:hypothetical protein